jgi:hypothetical protein
MQGGWIPCVPHAIFSQPYSQAHNMHILDLINQIKNKSKLLNVALHFLNVKQQHSLLSQVSWGKLEMKPKKDEK